MRIINNFIRKLELAQQLSKIKGENYLASYINSQKKVIARILEGNPYVLCTYYIPSEFTALFQLEILYLERIVGISTGVCIIENEEASTKNKIGCSYHQTFLELIREKIIPLPQRILCLEYPCQNCVDMCWYLHEQYKIPIDFIKQNNIEEQLTNLYGKLKQRYGLKQEITKTVWFSNEATKLKYKIDEIRGECPGIISSDNFLKIFTVENDFGTQTAIEVLSNLYDMLRERQADYVKDDRLKIFWMGLIPLNNNSILSSVEKKLPVSFVYEEMWMFGDCYIKEKNFFHEITSKIESGLFYNNYQRADRIISMMKLTESTLAINVTQKRCSFLPPVLKPVQQLLEAEGFGLENITTDVINEQLKTSELIDKIEKFI